MANCIYFTKNHNGYWGRFCLSEKHPKFSKTGGYKNSAHLTDSDKDVPKQCLDNGKGCPFFKK